MKRIYLCMVLVLIMAMFGCGKTEEVKDEASITVPSSTESTMDAVDYDFTKGKVYSQLTGELVKESVANNRIVTCMINNIDVAMPQSGLSKADIMYECVVEGGITRLMGVFQNYKSIKKLGPVRSARHYYVDFSNEYDAIYAHFGQTKYAVSEMSDLGTEELSGLSSLGNIIFYRDPNRVAPHNAYTDGEKIVAGIKASNFEKKNTFTGDRFNFNLDDEKLSYDEAKKCTYIDLRYNSYSHPYFKYQKGKYYRWQYNDPHMDDVYDVQLNYENVIIQFADYSDIDGKGYQDVDLVGSGDGYYASEGKYVPITWQKDDKESLTVYYGPDGNELKVNPGKTFISICPTAVKSDVQMLKSEPAN